MAIPGISHRPCGACEELVPADIGCPHWKPNNGPKKKGQWVRGRARQNITEANSLSAIQAYNRLLTPGQATR
jgi:hypothetical protein